LEHLNLSRISPRFHWPGISGFEYKFSFVFPCYILPKGWVRSSIGFGHLEGGGRSQPGIPRALKTTHPLLPTNFFIFA
jgi:hypothetical protein